MPTVQTGGGNKGFKGAMKTFDATRPLVSASANGIGRAAFEYTRDILAKEGVRMDYTKPRWKLSAVQADLLEMEAQVRAAWLLTLKATALLDAKKENKLGILDGQGQGGQVRRLGHAEGRRVAGPAAAIPPSCWSKNGCATPRSTTSSKEPARSTR